MPKHQEGPHKHGGWTDSRTGGSNAVTIVEQECQGAGTGSRACGLRRILVNGQEYPHRKQRVFTRDDILGSRA